MMAVRGLFQLVDRDSFDLKWQAAVVDVADVAFRAGHRDQHARSLLFLVKFPVADHRRHAKLAGDDRRVAGSPAMIGDDGGRDLHHRLPIRARGRRDKHFPGLERAEIAFVLDQPNIAGRDLFANRAACRRGPCPVDFKA